MGDLRGTGQGTGVPVAGRVGKNPVNPPKVARIMLFMHSFTWT